MIFDTVTRQEAEQAITKLLRYVGDDPARPGLQDTPRRVIKAFEEWCAGYIADPPEMKCFRKEGAGEAYDEMIVVRGIRFYSLCEHHLAPFFGTVDIGYLPGAKGIVGLSKLPRAAIYFAKRLQVQERLTEDIAGFLMEQLEPMGVGVSIRAEHLCMASRGICLPGTTTTTSSLKGIFLESEKVRNEFFQYHRS